MKMPWSKYRNIIPRKQNIINLMLKRAKIHWWLIGVVFIITTTWLVFPSDQRQMLIDSGDFKLGEKSPSDLFANLGFEYREVIDTEEEKQKILADVPPVFSLDFQGLKNVEEQFKIIRQVKQNKDLTHSMKLAKLKEEFYIGPSDKVGVILLEVSDDQLKIMEEEALKTLSNVLSRGIIADGEGANFASELSNIDYLKPKWNMIKDEIESKYGLPSTDVQIASRINISLVDNRLNFAGKKIVRLDELMPWSEARIVARNMANELPEPISDVVKEMVELMRPNLVYDPVATHKQQEQLIDNVSSLNQKIAKGDKILGIGDIVTESHIRKIEALASAEKKAILSSAPSVLLLVLILASLFVIYAEKQEHLFTTEPRKILALSIVILLIFAISNLIINQGPKLGLKSPGLLVPSALASIIIAIIANVQLSILSTCIIGSLIAISAGVGNADSFGYFLVTLTGGIAAAISASHARRRRHLVIPGLYVAMTNLVTIFGLRILTDTPTIKIGMDCLTGAVNGFIVALLTPGLLPIFEYISRTTTDMELLELSDLNQSLLTQLKEKASGSYYHSLDVAKLAEAAAEAIKANPLLARVGSYYHDIGKMAKPEYFIENQKGENVHDKLNPSMSSRVISSHVKDGVKLAHDSRLPKIIQDIIQHHHGNTLIGGLRFYQKAMEADRHNTVRLEDYRYPGPKPQSKEAAVILLADSIESARHVLLREDPSYSRLINFVRKIIEDKTMDSQLDESNLTLRDISLITDEFVRVLSGMYHTRIEYPKEHEVVTVGTEND
jgi:putative nucleotidyltransferase with HDIG domain